MFLRTSYSHSSVLDKIHHRGAIPWFNGPRVGYHSPLLLRTIPTSFETDELKRCHKQVGVPSTFPIMLHLQLSLAALLSGVSAQLPEASGPTNDYPPLFLAPEHAFRFDMKCFGARTVCKLMEESLKICGQRIATTITFQRQVVVQVQVGPQDDISVTDASFWSAKKGVNGQELLYPQALLKQSAVDYSSIFSVPDMVIGFDSKRYYFFNEFNKQIRNGQYDFECNI